MRITHFSDIQAEFIERAHTMVWASVATVDSQGRPRSRILHPIWEVTGGLPTGWIGTHRHSHKAKHLDGNPYVSLAYTANVMQPMYVDCVAEWVDDLAQKRRVWDWFRTTPEPLGYDPALTFGTVDRDDFGLLKLTPWRIDLVNFPAPSFEEGTKVWMNVDAGEHVAIRSGIRSPIPR